MSSRKSEYKNTTSISEYRDKRNKHTSSIRKQQQQHRIDKIRHDQYDTILDTKLDTNVDTILDTNSIENIINDIINGEVLKKVKALDDLNRLIKSHTDSTFWSFISGSLITSVLRAVNIRRTVDLELTVKTMKLLNLLSLESEVIVIDSLKGSIFLDECCEYMSFDGAKPVEAIQLGMSAISNHLLDDKSRCCELFFKLRIFFGKVCDTLDMLNPIIVESMTSMMSNGVLSLNNIDLEPYRRRLTLFFFKCNNVRIFNHLCTIMQPQWFSCSMNEPSTYSSHSVSSTPSTGLFEELLRLVLTRMVLPCHFLYVSSLMTRCVYHYIILNNDVEFTRICMDSHITAQLFKLLGKLPSQAQIVCLRLLYSLLDTEDIRVSTFTWSDGIGKECYIEVFSVLKNFLCFSNESTRVDAFCILSMLMSVNPMWQMIGEEMLILDTLCESVTSFTYKYQYQILKILFNQLLINKHAKSILLSSKYNLTSSIITLCHDHTIKHILLGLNMISTFLTNYSEYVVKFEMDGGIESLSSIDLSIHSNPYIVRLYCNIQGMLNENSNEIE